jgi:hypothetical protein
VAHAAAVGAEVVADSRFNVKLVITNRTQHVEREKRVAQVIERAKEEDDVEPAQFGLGDVVNGHLEALTLLLGIAKHVSAEVEGFPGASVFVAKSTQEIAEVVDCDHFFCPSLEGLKSPEAVPRTDVQDAFTGEVFGNAVSVAI